MTNKVVTTLAKAFYDAGLRTIRFNFRGVGQSAGVHDHGMGETEDVIAIAAWLQKIYPKDALWLAGFSFGGFVATRAATRLPVAKLITVAPQAARFQSEHLPPITSPWLIIQGELDEVVPPEEVYRWVDTLNPKPTLIKLPQAGHFFHKQLLELRKAVGEFLENP
jgi:alpha/beta superfamily hydrolase